MAQDVLRPLLRNHPFPLRRTGRGSRTLSPAARASWTRRDVDTSTGTVDQDRFPGKACAF